MKDKTKVKGAVILGILLAIPLTAFIGFNYFYYQGDWRDYVISCLWWSMLIILGMWCGEWIEHNWGEK